ncbi:Melanoma-associated antigen 9 [Saguinus oedipus]|uniref:Melanoma-associated antigen 9 n=1 Tax=Saguinus oedipus TaxID=9490 RepID=A0ABQ9VWR9_SAGOE|nr:Melanoma-associated antigen 9 [Saguinus oedipus]
MKLIFGIDVKEVDPTDQSYIPVTPIGLSSDGTLGDGHSMPKAALLIIVLGVILTKDNGTPEGLSGKLWVCLRPEDCQVEEPHGSLAWLFRPAGWVYPQNTQIRVLF